MQNSVSIPPLTVARIRVQLHQFKDLQDQRQRLDYARDDWKDTYDAIASAMVTWAYMMSGTLSGLSGFGE